MYKRAYIRRNIEYAAIQGIYWTIACISIVFSSVFLLERGYSNSQIGILMASGYIIGMLLQPIISSFADRSVKVTPTAIMAINCAVIALMLFGMCFLSKKSFLLTICYVSFLSFQLVLQPIVNAYCFYLEHQDTPIHYGIARGIGSLSWGLCAVILGFLVNRIGTYVLPIIGLFSIGLMLLILLICHFEGPSPLQQKKLNKTISPQSELTITSFSGKYRNFLFLLLGNTFLFLGHSQIDNFPFQIISNAGGTSTDLGIFSAYAAFLELPALFFFDYLREKIRCESLLCIAAFFFVVKGLLMCLLKSLTGIYIANFFQALSFAVFVPASVFYAKKISQPQDIYKAQSLITATATAGNILSSATGGFLIDTITVHGLLLVGCGASLIGLIFILISTNRHQHRKEIS